MVQQSAMYRGPKTHFFGMLISLSLIIYGLYEVRTSGINGASLMSIVGGGIIGVLMGTSDTSIISKIIAVFLVTFIAYNVFDGLSEWWEWVLYLMLVGGIIGIDIWEVNESNKRNKLLSRYV